MKYYIIKEVEERMEGRTPVEALNDTRNLVRWLEKENNEKMRAFIRLATIEILNHLEDFLVK